MGLFQGLGKASEAGAGRWLSPGNYLLENTELTAFKSRRPGKKDNTIFLGKFKVLGVEYTESEEVYNKAHGLPIYSAGDSVSWQATITTDEDDSNMGLRNVKSFLLAVFESTPDITKIMADDAKADAFAEKAVGPAQPLKGKKVLAAAYIIKVGKDEHDFTKIDWREVTPAVEAELAAQVSKAA